MTSGSRRYCFQKENPPFRRIQAYQDQELAGEYILAFPPPRGGERNEKIRNREEKSKGKRRETKMRKEEKRKKRRKKEIVNSLPPIVDK